MSEQMKTVSVDARAVANVCLNRSRIFTKETANDSDGALLELAGQLLTQLCDMVQRHDKMTR